MSTAAKQASAGPSEAGAGLRRRSEHRNSLDEGGRKLVRSVVTRRPVTRVIVLGTKRASNCDPNYSGQCVPIASDVDCGGGSGNGPAYVYGVVKVVGDDIYDLDRDGDGYGCE